VESAADLSGTKFKRGPAAPWSLIESVTLTDGNHVRVVLDAVRVDSPSMAPRSTKLVLRGFTLTLTGDVMTGKALERDVPARLDRLPDGFPFGCAASLRSKRGATRRAEDGKHVPKARRRRGDPLRRIVRRASAHTRERSLARKPSHVRLSALTWRAAVPIWPCR
jgi:hypothetical protein